MLDIFKPIPFYLKLSINSLKKRIIFHYLIMIMFFCSQPILKAQENEKKITEIKGYIGLVHPLYTFSNDGNTQNFKTNYIV